MGEVQINAGYDFGLNDIWRDNISSHNYGSSNYD